MQFRASRARLFFALAVLITGPLTLSGQSANPLAVADGYVTSNAARYGLTPSDIAERRVSDNYRTQHSGLTHIYYLQRHQGIDVFNAIFNLAVTPSGQIVAPASTFAKNLSQRVNTTTPVISAEAAVLSAARSLGITGGGPLAVKENIGGASRAVVFAGGNVSRSDIPAKLMYLPTGNAVRLTWDVTIDQSSDHIWMVKVDAVSGDVLHKMDMVQTDSYQVYAFPAESPNHVSGLPVPPGDGRTIVSGNVADPIASPFGWHDTNGVAGADTSNTTGNNVRAQTDLPLVPGQTVTDGSFTPGLDVQPTNPNREFHYPLDLTTNPETYREAVVTNLFYWNNVIHDIMYKYGFDEASGNFQTNNYGRGGRANDSVIADAQDGSGTNNANFATPTDGSAPRMQMFIWLPSKGHQVVVNSPAGLGMYQASGATFGKQLDATGITGEVVLVNDGAGVTWDFCEPMGVGSLVGKIALAERGTCNFTVKAQNADRAGAAGLIVVNNQGDNETLTMGSLTPQTDALILTPSQMIGRRDGLQLKANLPANVTMRNVGGNIPRRDSDLDSAVIVHEYGHGISIRLTGGPATNSCLSTPQQGGEGWSDFFGLVLTAQPHHTASTPRGIGTYLTYEDDLATARGIRPYPYTTDMSVNPQTYGHLTTGKLSVPHGVGSVWATTLWDMYWALVSGVPERGLPALGFRQDLYDTTSPLAGNQIALRLVMDGLKLQPCDPSFIEARNAILAADQATFGGQYSCYIWWAFARRGMGVNADDGNDSLDVSEDFSTPASCTPGSCLVSPTFKGAHSVVSATDGSTKLTVRWDAATANCGTSSVTYNVYRSTESGFAPGAANLIASGLTGTSYSDTKVSSGVRYFYVTRAVDSAGNVDANLKRRSGVATGALVAGAQFFDDAGDTRPQQFIPSSAVLSWAVRGTEGFAQTRGYATSASANYPDAACMQLESDTIYLGADPDLQFLSSYQIEPAWDGGIVEVATEGGNFGDWTKLTTLNYPGVMNGPQGDPACGNTGLKDGELAFNGAMPTFVPFTGSLAQWANQNVRLRFVFGSDAGTNLGGWLIDNISVDDVRAAGATACHEDDGSNIEYSSGWHKVNDPDASGGSFRLHMGKDPSHGLAFSFNVTSGTSSLTYYYAKSAKGGTADVYVDGVLKGTIDYRGSASKSHDPEFGFSFRVEGLGSGSHKFELRNLRDAVYIDRLCLTNATASTTLPVNIPGVTLASITSALPGVDTVQNLTLPSGSSSLSIVAESTPNAPLKIVVLDPLGSIVSVANSSDGYAVLDTPVSRSGLYVVKITNLGTTSVSLWSASTPLVKR